MRVRLVLVLILGVVSFSRSGTAQPVIDEIVALVDDNILLRSDVNGFVYNIMQQQGVPFSAGLWFDALDNMINQKVLATHAKRDTTLAISDEEITFMLDERVNQMALELGGQARLEDLYGKSAAQIKADLREDFEDQMLAERFQGRKLQSIRITPSEVATWFEQIPTDSLPTVPATVRLAHIVRFPEVTDGARESARAILSTIRDSIVTGSSFEEYAQRYSDDPGSADNGGRYQNVRIGVFVPEFSAVASRSAIGETSEIFESRFGLHILRVNERRGDILDLNQILIEFDRDQFDPSEALSLLSTLRDSVLTHGRPFAVMAKEYSEEPSSAASSGRVVDPRTGDRSLVIDALGPTWKLNIADLDPGDISEPAEVLLLDGRRAYHIVLLQERSDAHPIDFDTDYELISAGALREKQAREMSAWFAKLREDVFVELRATRSPSPASADSSSQ